MEAKQWRSIIEADLISLQIYKSEFNSVISTLADMLEERDRVRDLYRERGSQPLVLVVSDRGAENMRKNPLLDTWQQLNRDCLQYWRDLGLTPSGLKKLDDNSKIGEKRSALDELLSELEDI